MDDRAGSLAAALRALPLAQFGSRVSEVLRDVAGLADATLRLVDYAGDELRLLAGEGPVTVAVTGTAEGAAFRDRRMVADGDRVHAPVTCRGNRLGVLTATAGPDLPDLTEIGDVLADALQVANLGTDELVRARRGDRMTLAAEMQWELLPGRELHASQFTLAGQLRPAYQVRGDNFDWSLDPGRLTLTVTNGMGEGLAASMLTGVVISALRNARRSGMALADQASSAEQAVWSQFDGKRHVAALLLTVDLADGAMRLIDAGSPRMWRQRDGELSLVELDAQLPLGMFGDTTYTPQVDRLLPGDRLVIVSDGVYTVRDGEREYISHSMPRVLGRSRGLTPSDTVRTILSDLRVFCGGREQDDDVVVVCLDWRG